MKRFILVAAILYSATQLRSAQCFTACIWAGYDEGYFDKDRCACIEFKDFKRMTREKRVKLPSRATHPEKKETRLDYGPSSTDLLP